MKRAYGGNEVAIIGIACRFPRSPDWQSFWNNLLAGRELVSFFSADELAAAGEPTQISELPGYVPAKAVLEDADCFDYKFFGYSKREAQRMDPQLRVLHELGYNAFVDAGILPGKAALNAGVFVGSTLNVRRLERFAGASADIRELYDVGNYNDPASLPAQLAYRMKVTGPAVNVQTACSTSLSAVHVACKALLAGECELALAGGVCITDPVAAGYVHRDGMILSPDGHCRPFSADANGTVNGNGAAVVLLKLLENALADGDPIHAVILESAMNNDGDRKVSFEAPSVQGQAAVIAQVYRVAGIPFSSLGMIEAHGTATALGDPIEIRALNNVARELLTPEEQGEFRCAVGSVKSNLGHLDAAAGIAGLIKAALSVRFGTIPPSLHFAGPNPRLELHATPFWVPTEALAWPKHAVLRRAGVSSFGIGGTNVHVLLEQPPGAGDDIVSGGGDGSQLAIAAEEQTVPEMHVLPLSAATPCALSHLVAAHARHAALDPDTMALLAPIARQLQENRAEYVCRAAFVADSLQTFQQQLREWSSVQFTEDAATDQIWLLAAEGAELSATGLRLAQAYPQFAQYYFALLDQAARALSTERSALLRCQPGQTPYRQAALYAAQVALGLWLHDIGCRPAAVCGFGLGELAAAAIAGVLEPWQGMQLVIARAPTHGLPQVGEPLHASALQQARFPIYSAALGRRMTAIEIGTLAHWVGPMLTPVRWQDTLQELRTDLPASLLVQIAGGDDLLQRARDGGWVDAGRLLPTWAVLDGAEVAATLRCIARAWAQGGRVEWERLRSCAPADAQMQRSHLPGHAFERSVCSEPPTTNEQQIASLFFGDRCYGLEWEQVVEPDAECAGAPQSTQTWIICPTLTQREHRLAQALRTSPNDPRFITCPPWQGSFETIHTQLEAWLSQQELQSSACMDVIVTGLLHELDAQQAQFWSFWLPVVLARWSAGAHPAPKMRLIFPAVGMSAWSDAEPLHPEKHQLLGPLLIVPQEYPAISVLCIDTQRCDAESVAASLRSWMQTQWHGGHFYCARSGALWRRKVTAKIQRTAAPYALPPINRNSWVLVTGASGGMGRAIAGHLARVYHCNLLLLVRHAVAGQPAPDAAGGSHAAQSEFATWLQQLQSQANRVEVLRAELGDADELARALAPIIARVARGMQLDYVFHTAGRGEGALLQMRSESESLATLAPKVTGTRVLCERLAQLGNPVLLLFSSLGNLVPKEKVGQLAYVAANACLEAHAEHARRQGGRVLAIAWDDWSEAGMAVRSARQLDRVLQATFDTATHETRVWRRQLSAQHDWWLHEHRLDATTTVMPAMGMVVLVLTAIGEIESAPRAAFSLHDMTLEQPLVVADAEQVDVAVTFAATPGTFEIYSGTGAFSAQTWRKHAVGKVRRHSAPDVPAQPAPAAAVVRRLFEAPAGAGVSPRGTLQFGPRWQNVLSVDLISVDRIGEQEILNVLELPAAYRGEAEAHGLHVALLDTATLTGSPDHESPSHESSEFAPASIGSFTQFAPMTDRVRSWVEVRDLGSGKLLQVRIFAPDGRPLVRITDLLLVDATRLIAAAAAPAAVRSNLMHRVMRLRPRGAGGAEFAFASRLEPRREPGPQEVEIQVKAAGLNFKDVLIALEVLPAPADPTMTFGQEAAGVITRVGSQVQDLQVGDRVMCAGHSCLAEHVIMPHRVVARMPSTLGFQQAAGIPVAFTTAWIALKHAAHLRKGERILIHSAASGVGMAALQIAKHLGARVWATAGSEEKCRLLQSMGAEGTASSRTGEFAAAFRRQLGDRPFDVVLNALAGELQQESIALLAPQGRFLELGLRDILAGGQLALSIFAQGGSFHAVQAGADHPAYQQAWAELIELLEEEVLLPLPTRIYPAAQIADAFQLMAQGRHLGKIVIAMAEHERERSFVEKLQAEGLSNTEGARVAMAMAAIAAGTPLAYVAVSKLPIGLVLEKQQHTQQMLLGSSVASPPVSIESGLGAAAVETTLEGAGADALLAAMQAMLGSFLGVTALDPEVSFFELGATSLDLIQFARQLESRLKREIPVALLFKAGSLRELSMELAQAGSMEAAPQIAPAAVEDRRRTLNARRRLRGAGSRVESELDE